MGSPKDADHGIRRIDGGLTIALLLILAARLLLASLVYAHPELAIANDSDRYIPIANSILKGTAYTWNTERPGELLNTVGYPLFLASVFALLGSGAGDIALAQLLLSGVLAFGLYALLARRIGATAAFAGAVLLALDPLTALWSMTVLTETLFAAALGLAAGFLVAWTHDQKLPLLALAGLFGGLACLVRPIALLVAVLWVACVVLFPQRAGQPRRRRYLDAIRRAIVFSLPILLLVVPWYVRNYQLWNCAALSSVDRVTLRDYMVAKVLGEVEHVPLEEAQSRLQASDPGVCPQQTGKYWGILLANPAIYARLHVAGTVPILIATNFDRWLQYLGQEYSLPDLWRPLMDGGLNGLGRVILAQAAEFPSAIVLMFALTAFQIVLYFLALAGAIATFRRSETQFKWIVVTLATTIAILVLTPGQSGHERFRVPVQPMLAILISYGAAATGGLNAWRRRGADRASTSVPQTV